MYGFLFWGLNREVSKDILMKAIYYIQPQSSKAFVQVSLSKYLWNNDFPIHLPVCICKQTILYFYVTYLIFQQINVSSFIQSMLHLPIGMRTHIQNLNHPRLLINQLQNVILIAMAKYLLTIPDIAD